MKKIIAIIVFLVMVMSISISIADVDLSSMSFDELLALQDAVKAEIMARPENTYSVLNPGVYYCGKDILPGDYYFLYDSGASYGSTVYIYKNEEDFVEGYSENTIRKSLYSIDLKPHGDSLRTTLEIGFIVIVRDAAIKVSAADFSDEVKNLAIIPEKAKQVPAGYYIVGTDIAPGKYTAYVPVGNSETVRVYANEDAYLSDGKYDYYEMRNGTWSVTFPLQEGQVFSVKGTIYMTKAEQTMLTFD